MLNILGNRYHYQQNRKQPRSNQGLSRNNPQDWRCLERRCFSFHSNWAVSCSDV